MHSRRSIRRQQRRPGSNEVRAGGPVFASGSESSIFRGDTHMDRRGFLQNVAASAVGGATCLQGSQARETVDAKKPRRATLAQVVIHKSIKENLANARRAFEQAGKDKADFVL